MRNEQQEAATIWLQRGGIVAGAFVFTLLIYMVCLRFMESTKKRFTPLMTAAEMERQGYPTTNPTRTLGYSPFSPNMPPRATGTYTMASGGRGVLAPPPPVLTPPSRATIDQILGTMNFANEAERNSARRAVQSLQVAVQNVKQYDNSSFWEALPEANKIPATTSGANTANPVSAEQGDDRQIYAANTNDAAAQRQRIIERIHKETEALATELVLVTHPDLFPKPLQELAGLAGREARIYLSTVQRSLTRPTSERNELRTLAQQHLNQSEQTLKELERAVGTGAVLGANARP